MTKCKISSPYGYRFFITPERIEEIKNQTSKTGFWWSPPHSINERSVITVSKQIDSNRVRCTGFEFECANGSADHSRRAAANLSVYRPRRVFVDEHVSRLSEDVSGSFGNEGCLASVNPDERDGLSTPFTLLMETIRCSAVIKIAGTGLFSPSSRSRRRFLCWTRSSNSWCLVLLIAIILAVIVSVWITNYIRKPVTAITRQFKAAARGELEARIKLKRNDEFTHIADGFNRMMGNIQSLFDDLRVAEEKKRHHELKVLQSQIHPHFLNNTLNAIYCLGETGQTR